MQLTHDGFMVAGAEIGPFPTYYFPPSSLLGVGLNVPLLFSLLISHWGDQSS